MTELASGTRTLRSTERLEAAPLGRLCVYLHGVSDPGNVGTALRSAAAFGASCVALGGGQRRPVQPQGGAREHGRDFRRTGRPRDPYKLPGTTIALVAEADDTLDAVAADLVPQKPRSACARLVLNAQA